MTTDRPHSVLYQLFMLVLCLITLAILGIDAAMQLPPEVRALLQYADTGICAIFFLDFLISVRHAPSRWRYSIPGAGSI